MICPPPPPPETFWTLLHSGPHWTFELMLEGLTAIPGVLYARIWVKRHDRKNHPTRNEQARCL